MIGLPCLVSLCQVARSWVDVGSFHTRLFGVVYFPIASVREFLDTPSYIRPFNLKKEMKGQTRVAEFWHTRYTLPELLCSCCHHALVSIIIQDSHLSPWLGLRVTDNKSSESTPSVAPHIFTFVGNIFLKQPFPTHPSILNKRQQLFLTADGMRIFQSNARIEDVRKETPCR
jgi:hypothetical protein